MKMLSLPATLFTLTCACSGYDAPEIIGEWQSAAPVGSLGVNTLTVRESLRGEATIRFYYTDDDGAQHGASLGYSVRCELDGDGAVCDFTCTESGLSAYDFTMTCPEGGTRMKCDADRLFDGYKFDWQKQD